MIFIGDYISGDLKILGVESRDTDKKEYSLKIQGELSHKQMDDISFNEIFFCEKSNFLFTAGSILKVWRVVQMASDTNQMQFKLFYSIPRDVKYQKSIYFDFRNKTLFLGLDKELELWSFDYLKDKFVFAQSIEFDVTTFKRCILVADTQKGYLHHLRQEDDHFNTIRFIP